jgi:membrane fusion protein (multidrug efflux system)
MSLTILIVSIIAIVAILGALVSFAWLRMVVVGTVLALIALVCVLADIKLFQFKQLGSMKMNMPPTTVSSAVVKEEAWAPTLSAVGSISPVQGALVSAELAGVVSQIGFDNGGVAKKGDLLVQLDASSEEAQMHSSEADLELARADLDRARDLSSRKVVSKAELDNAEAKFKQKSASVDQMRSMISKKTVRAPFEGQLGIRQVNIGQTVNPGQPVVALQSLDPVFVDFALPQQYLGQLSTGLDVNVTTDAVRNRVFNGKLTAVYSMVDVATRNVTLQATFSNPDHVLRPGMFAKIDVVLPSKEHSIVIPGTAISYAPYGDSVFIIEKKADPKTGQESQVIRQQFIRVGETRGDFVSVREGLKIGETLVSSGVFKLRNGMSVTINNNLAPTLQEKPKPEDT